VNYSLKIQAYGEKAILINWPNRIDEQISKELLFIKDYLNEEFENDLIDISNGYQSLLLYFKSEVTQGLLQEIQLKLKGKNLLEKERELKIWEIPVCYDIEFGIDLEFFLEEKQLTLEELIESHTKPLYHVYCKGFLPGFLYLGGLDEKLHLARKSTPNLRIPKNSVAVGGEQTGVYPSQSPGGWHVIGRTPISFFDIKSEVFSVIKTGDKVKFKSVSREEFFELKNQKTLKTIG